MFPYLYQVRDKDIQLLRSNGLIRVNSKVQIHLKIVKVTNEMKAVVSDVSGYLI